MRTLNRIRKLWFREKEIGQRSSKRENKTESICEKRGEMDTRKKRYWGEKVWSPRVR